MTNIDCNELSDVELGAVSGGDYTITISQQTVAKVQGAAQTFTSSCCLAGAVALLAVDVAYAAGRETAKK